MKRENIISFAKRFYPVLVFFLVYLYIFRVVFFKGFVPYPSDLLVSYFFPYNSGGWEGFQAFVAHKEFIASDVVRQIYPWRVLAMELIKSGQVPLWNPYAFSGTPLLANLQSAVFYPLNILFFMFSNKTAWITYVMLQPVIAFISMYLFIRSLKLGKEAALFSGIAFGFISYTMIWFELGVVGHTAAWLPLGLYGINRFTETKMSIYLLVTVLALSCVLFAGHAQTAVYIFLLTFAYYLFRSWRKITLPHKLRNGLILLLPVGIGAIQLLPSIELLSLAARNTATSSAVFYRMQLPVQHLIMLFAPDFYGNPAVNNFWGVDYNEFISYVGIVALVFAFLGIFSGIKDGHVRFFVISGIIALLFALPTPLSNLLQLLNIPVLGTGIPARSLFVLEFALVVLAGYGVSQLMKGKIVLVPIFMLGLCYVVIWGIVLGFPSLIPKLTENGGIAQRNLIIPSLIFAVTAGSIILTRLRPSLKYLLFAGLICCAAFEYQYVFYKYLPFAPVAFIFPNHSLIQQLQKVSGTSRVYGYDTARFEPNMTTAWQLYSPEGYDPLYLRRYGELMYASQIGKLVRTIPRSDATLELTLPVQDSREKQLLMNLMDVRYIADKDEFATKIRYQDAAKYNADRFRLIWQEGKYRIYENTRAYPRASVYYSWVTGSSDDEIVNTLFQKDFPVNDTLILSETPGRRSALPAAPATVTSFTASQVTIRARAEAAGMLFLSDAYAPGWKAEVDGKEAPLYAADYAFRAVPLSKGDHTVVFHYQPESFRAGIAVTGMSAITFILLLFYCLRSFRFRKSKDINNNHSPKRRNK
jgi:hypothetical protein